MKDQCGDETQGTSGLCSRYCDYKDAFGAFGVFHAVQCHQVEGDEINITFLTQSPVSIEERLEKIMYFS